MFVSGLILMVIGVALFRTVSMSGGQIIGGYWPSIILFFLGGALFWCSFKK